MLVTLIQDQSTVHPFERLERLREQVFGGFVLTEIGQQAAERNLCFADLAGIAALIGRLERRQQIRLRLAVTAQKHQCIRPVSQGVQQFFGRADPTKNRDRLEVFVRRTLHITVVKVNRGPDLSDIRQLFWFEALLFDAFDQLARALRVVRVQ